MRLSRASRGLGFLSAFHSSNNNTTTNATTTTPATATTSIRQSDGSSSTNGNNNNEADEMNPLHVPLSFLPLLLVLFILSFHGGSSSASTSTNNNSRRGVMEGTITTSTVYSDTFSPGTSTTGQQQYRTRPAGFGATFDYGEVYPAHLQVISTDVHLCGSGVHSTYYDYGTPLRPHHHHPHGGVDEEDEETKGRWWGGGMLSSSSSRRRLYNDTTKDDEKDIHVVPVLPDKNGRHIPGEIQKNQDSFFCPMLNTIDTLTLIIPPPYPPYLILFSAYLTLFHLCNNIIYINQNTLFPPQQHKKSCHTRQERWVFLRTKGTCCQSTYLTSWISPFLNRI